MSGLSGTGRFYFVQLGSKEDSLINSARVLEFVFILRNVKATCKPLGPGVPLLASLSFLLNWFLPFFRLDRWKVHVLSVRSSSWASVFLISASVCSL